MRVHLTASLVALAVVGAASAMAAAPSSERTYPRVRPHKGSPHTVFELTFKVRQKLGHAGVVATDYRVQVSPYRRARAACSPPQPAAISSGSPGQVMRVPLQPPGGGWCKRRYTVTVFLQRGPYCPPPTAGQPPQPCPEFATQDLDTGEAHFTVVS